MITTSLKYACMPFTDKNQYIDSSPHMFVH